MKRRFALLSLLLATLCLGGCRGEPSGSACVDSEAGAPVDPKLLAFLSRSRSAHHLADLAEEQEDLERASSVLRDLIAGPQPSDNGSAPEVREVLADTRARLADLESRLGRFDAAAEHVDKGLELARETTYFRGHLFEMRGLVEERRSKALRDEGQVAEADAAKKRALDAFEQSMEIQADVIQKALPADGAP
jgi:tetratricopeptide (TPR) repeat protein